MKRGKIVARGTPEQIKAELVEEFVLIDAEDRSALRAELLRLRLSFVETSRFKLPLSTGAIHETLKAIRTPLTFVQTHTSTLEEAYLEIVGETDDARE